MPHRRRHLDQEQWRPEVPPHTHPWGSWATWAILEAHQRGKETDERMTALEEDLARRKEVIEAAAVSRVSTLEWLDPIKPHLWKVVLVIILMLGSWISTGRLPDPWTLASKLLGG